MNPQSETSRFSRQVAQAIIGVVLTVVLLGLTSGTARTDETVTEAFTPPSCNPNTPNTAITAVYCAYGGAAKFGSTNDPKEEVWNDDSGDKKREFQFGTIYYVDESHAAFALFNHVRDYYEQHPSLGKPITSEIGSQADGFCKAFFTDDKLLECHGVNNPIEVKWTQEAVYLPRLQMPFEAGRTEKFNAGPHAWDSFPATKSAVDGSGLDIGMTGEVRTMASGTVIEIASESGNVPADCSVFNAGLGCWVAVRNDFSGTVIVYGHLQPNDTARVGHWIAAGSPIGNIEDCSGSGCIGRSEGHHVHLELRDGRSSGDTGAALWGNPLSWHGVTIGKYLISGGYESVSATDALGNAFQYDGTAVTYTEPVLDVHRRYTQPELARTLDWDDYEFGKFKFNDNGTPLQMFAWMTQAAWDECKARCDPNDLGQDLWCETPPSYGGTVFAYGDLGASSAARMADEVEPLLESSNVAIPYEPLFSPPDDPSTPPTCAPTADQVALYDDATYGSGKPCRLLNIGSYDSLGSLDNATSSVRVGANVKVTLYSEANRGGDSETLTADDPDLANNEIIQRNEASSALVQPNGEGGSGCQPGDYQVALFDDVYFNPNKPCRVLALGDYSTLGDLDNIVSSVKVGSKVTLVLFENTGYGGSNETFYHDDYNLDDNDHIQKNETSSAKVLLRESGGYSYCNKEQNPGETEVILFDNPRYGAGPCAILKVGEYPDLSSISFENEASSLRVGGKVKVMVCTEKRFDESEESGGECETYSSHVPDLDETGEVPRDKTSSAKVEMKLLCHPLADGVILYENSNYGGGCTTLTAGTWNLSDFRYDDMVSSLRFVGSYASGWSVRLCQSSNLGGTCSTFTGNDSSLSGDAVGNDRASSIAIVPLPPSSAPSLTEIGNPESLGTYQVSWTAVANATAYELEEQLNGSAWVNAYTGEATSTVVIGRSQGTWCYRVRAVNVGGSSPWSSTTVCTTVVPPIADPDLKVNAITLGNLSPTVGQSITVDVEIRNIGQATAGSSTCALYQGDPAAGGTQIATADCGNLSPNINSVVNFNWTPNQPGRVVLFAVADSDNMLPESDETNNRGSVTVDVQPPTTGSQTTDILAYAQGTAPDAIWFANGHSHAPFFTRNLSFRNDGFYDQLVAGDFNGDGLSDFVAFGRGTALDALWFGTGNSQEPFFTRGYGFKDDGLYDQLVAGDFNGDGLSDIVAFGRGTAPDAVWFATGNSRAPFFTRGYGFRDDGLFDQLVAGDFNGDGFADILAFGRGSTPDAMWLATGNSQAPFFTKNFGFRDYGTYSLVAGDFSGDGLTDIVAYGWGTAPDAMWLATGNSQAPFFTKNFGFRDDGLYAQLVAGDFNGDELTDVLAYGWGTAPDAVWLSNGNSQAPFFAKSLGFRENTAFDMLIAGQFDGN